MLSFFHLYLVFFIVHLIIFMHCATFQVTLRRFDGAILLQLIVHSCFALCSCFYFSILLSYYCYFIVLIVIYKRLYFLVVNLITTSLLFAQAFQIEHHRFDQAPSIIALDFQLSIIASADNHYSVVQRSL